MLISIVMVTYNAAKYVENSLLSAINQDYKNKEIIVIDGASTDGTVEILNRYREKLSCFVSEPDEGIHDAVNKGIQSSNGDYVCFLNAGDWFVDKHVLSRSAQKILPDTDVYAGAIYKQFGLQWKKFDSERDLALLYEGCCVQWLASFFRKSVFVRYGELNKQYKIAGDYDYFLRLYENHAVFQFTSDPVVLMFDGGISSDLCKGGYQESCHIQCCHGVPFFFAKTLCYKRIVKQKILKFLQYIGVEDAVKSVFRKPKKLSQFDMENLGFNIQKPWFLT